MANSNHLLVLREGAPRWNKWRKANPDIAPDLSNADFRDAKLPGINLCGADLFGADFCGADLSRAIITHAAAATIRLCDADLHEADFSHSNLRYANFNCANLRHATLAKAELWFAILNSTDLSHADMQRADLRSAQLYEAKLVNADLRAASFSVAWLENADLRGARFESASFDSASLARANLSGADLSGVDLSADLIETNLSNANLTGAKLAGMLIRTNLRNANLSNCHVHGVSIWDAQLEGATQKGLIITPDTKPEVSVDDLEMAQFVYLLMNNRKIKSIVETLTSKTVLLLGRFTPARKAVLDELRSYIRLRHGYVPILFDFQKPSLTTLETVTLLARMSKLVIADLSAAKCVLEELTAIVPMSPSIFVQPIIAADQRVPAMIDFFKSYPWFRPVLKYRTVNHLKQSLDELIARNGWLQASPEAALAERGRSGATRTRVSAQLPSQSRHRTKLGVRRIKQPLQ